VGGTGQGPHCHRQGRLSVGARLGQRGIEAVQIRKEARLDGLALRGAEHQVRVSVGEDRGPGVRGMIGAHERRVQGRDAVSLGFHAFSLVGDGRVSNA
jgi:hypothetical protein